MQTQDEIILDVKKINKTFHSKKGFINPEVLKVRAVNDVSFQVKKGEVFGIVGESGCGKSTIGKCIMDLIPIDDGEMTFKGKNLRNLSKEDRAQVKQDLQIIFQDPYSSLNPRKRIGPTLMEPLLVYKIAKDKEMAEEIVQDIFKEVGLPEQAFWKFPHEFSGGQRQRIAIARSLILNPDLIVADEAVSALDVSIQAQILLLLKNLKQQRDLSYIFISHDMGVIRYFCDRVAVAYLGQIVEIQSVPDIFERPAHPYTKTLKEASPVPSYDPDRTFNVLEGELPSPSNLPSGCYFHGRCPKATEHCTKVMPDLMPYKDGMVRCHHPE
ncbi:ABC transporter ATP-binding protein [Terasakiella pusilla]|uniref:ABC transporter ATP-binding protein n=1 Tax=Terasakiella pusilla TaxID=64973 RepID=UPI00048F76A1|nr:oligopeptide/dipeptide ABC transporter ATP-binding protein [Terasakiella pusilla]